MTLFLFGDAHREHYKECEGSVLLVSCPETKFEEGRLSISTREPGVVALLGISPDFAYCAGTKGVRR